MIALGRTEIPLFKGIGHQRGMVFGGFAQVDGRTASPSLTKGVVPATKRVSANVFEVAETKTADGVCGRKLSSQLKKLQKKSKGIF